MTNPLMDRSIAAIRARADASIIWAEGEVSQRVSDQLWAAKQDTSALLQRVAELEAALRKLASDSEITGALGTGDIHAQVRAALVSDTAGETP